MDTSSATHAGHRASCDMKSGSTWYNSVDVWYQYTASATGLVEVRLSGCSSTITSSTASNLSAWSGCEAVDASVCARTACNSLISFPVIAGNSYLVRAATFASSSSASSAVRRGTATVTFTEFAPPSNEDCANALEVGPGTQTWNDSLAIANGPLPPCSSTPDQVTQKDLWYAYTATVTGVATLASTGVWISVHDTCAAATTYACANGNASVSITAGSRYLVRIARPAGSAGGAGTLAITEFALASNDTCETAQDVGPGEYTWNDGGDDSPDGPFPTCGVGSSPDQRDVWYAFTASVNGNVTVDCRVATAAAPGTNNQTTIAVFTACNGSLLTCASQNAAKRWVCFPVTIGQRYLIRLARAGTSAREPWKVAINEYATPGGDSWQTATQLTPGTQVYGTQGACDKDQFESSVDCYGLASPGAGVWFYFDPPEEGVASFDTSSGTIDTVFVAYGSNANGDCNGQILACSNDLGHQATLGSYISLPAHVGSRIYLRADTRFSTSNIIYQNFTLTTDIAPPYANDECLGAFPLSLGTTSFDSRRATDSVGVPEPSCNATGNLGPTRHDLWWSWTPTQNGITRISTCRNPAPLIGSNATVLSVYSNCSLAQELFCNDDPLDVDLQTWTGLCTDEQSALAFPSNAGTTYLIRVANHREYLGPGVINLSYVPNTCTADFNNSGTLDVTDIFDYLNAWFASNPAADLNSDGLDVQDLFNFLNLWFLGCP